MLPLALLGMLLTPVSTPTPSATEFASLLETTVVLITLDEPKPENAIGTGFVVSADGHVVTADHVVADENGAPHPKLFAIRFNGAGHDVYELAVVKRIRKDGRDIALLRISEKPAKALPFLKVAGSDAPLAGADIMIAGFPKVFDDKGVKAYPFVRRGTIASTRLHWNTGASVLLLDMTPVFGFSGSPVLQLSTGSVVGVFKGGPSGPIGMSTVNFSVASPLDAKTLWVPDNE